MIFYSTKAQIYSAYSFLKNLNLLLTLEKFGIVYYFFEKAYKRAHFFKKKKISSRAYNLNFIGKV